MKPKKTEVQQHASQIAGNRKAWEHGPYAAWVKRYGSPEAAAKRLVSKPGRGMEPILKHLTDVRGKRVINIMGSHGMKAVAMALLGADVSVIDYSEENAAYCREVSELAGVCVEYVIADVLSPPDLEPFDVGFAELGILHYFTHLEPFAGAVAGLISIKGTFVLRDFHPVSTKLLAYRGSTAKVRKYKVTGNYFDNSIEELPAPFLKHLETSDETQTVRWRKWTIGEIVTAFASSGFRIESLSEEPNQSSEVFDAGIPKTFTLVSVREE